MVNFITLVSSKCSTTGFLSDGWSVRYTIVIALDLEHESFLPGYGWAKAGWGMHLLPARGRLHINYLYQLMCAFTPRGGWPVENTRIKIPHPSFAEAGCEDSFDVFSVCSKFPVWVARGKHG